MEALAHDATFEFDQMGLTPSYDPSTNSFIQSQDGGVPVRQVNQKKLPARDQDGQVHPNKFDLFNGIIDGVTGEPLHGTRHYSLTGELYEGKFRGGGLRHGDGAIVKNISLPPPREAIPELLGEFAGVESPHSNLSFGRANFFGSFFNDEPSFGTLVTDTYTYRGHFARRRFHGLQGELIHTDGYKYVGEFVDGLFHGFGREVDPVRGVYKGEFRNGMKHGIGTYKEGPPEEGDEEKAETEPLGEAEKKAQEFEEAFEPKDLCDDFGEQDWNPEAALAQDESETIKDEDNVSDEFFAVKIPSKYIYSGQFHCNQRQGEGTEWTPDGHVYSGQFLANRRHGHGSLKILSTGIIYEGKWRAGEPIDGNGWRILYPSGDIYCGHARHYEPHGYGIYQHASGDVYSGDWNNGRRHGNGIHSDPNGTEFSGRWKNGRVVSRKRLEETDGTLSEIAETLRITESFAEEQQAGDVTEEAEGGNSKHEKQLAFLKQAMAKSIETSLHIIASKANEDSEDEENDTPEDLVQEAVSDALTPIDESKPRAELHTYANGDTYLGCLDPDTSQRTGYGVYVSKSTGCSYTGEFRKNKRHGFGILIHNQFGKYAGEFKSDKKHGEGTLILSDASSYHGGFVDGAFDGNGTLCERNGTVYVGEWRAGLRNGEGMETMSDGRVYKGTFRNGKKEGSGTLLEKSAGKIIYRGSWRDGKYHGEGRLIERQTIPSSSSTIVVRWEGTFVGGEKHGYGVLTNETENTEYKGVWSHNVPVSGKWRIQFRDGGIYSGQARVLDDNKCGSEQVLAIPEGFGTYQYANGDVYVGQFEFGIRSGEGNCQFVSGERWEGAWKGDQLDKSGSGTLTMADGMVHEFRGNKCKKSANASIGKLLM